MMMMIVMMIVIMGVTSSLKMLTPFTSPGVHGMWFELGFQIYPCIFCKFGWILEQTKRHLQQNTLKPKSREFGSPGKAPHVFLVREKVVGRIKKQLWVATSKDFKPCHWSIPPKVCVCVCPVMSYLLEKRNPCRFENKHIHIQSWKKNDVSHIF